MQELGDKARWPKQGQKSSAWKDKSKWCAYHEDFGHNTEDCFALRKEISYLLSKGLLREIISRKEKPRAKDTNMEDVAEKNTLAENTKVINFISGGSDVCGTSYSAAKRHSREMKTEREWKPDGNTTLTNDKEISFDEDDRIEVKDPHHDGLVITLHIANHYVRRILIDGGSSVNLILLDTLKKMNIPESEIIQRSSVLVGFSGEVKNTIGDIRLPVYIEGVNSVQPFCVIDSMSSFNIILGRPWIHSMKAVPSTYHQCIKMPTPWGIVKIQGDQQESRNCYTTSLKPSKLTKQNP